MHLQSIELSSAIQPNTGLAGTIATGDSFVTQAARPDSKIMLVSWLLKNQVAGWHQAAWPSGHDTTRGIRIHTPIGTPMNVIPWGLPALLKPQETIRSR